MWDTMINGINEVANKVFEAILILLPTSPFKDFEMPASIKPYLGYINYYIPFSKMLVIALAWISAIGVYKIYQMILRNIRAVK